MNRRDFLRRGAAAATAVVAAPVLPGAVERFLVGSYGAPAGVAVNWGTFSKVPVVQLLTTYACELGYLMKWELKL